MLQGLDVLQAMDDKAVTVVALSIICNPDSPGYKRVRNVGSLAPPVEKGLAVMEELARKNK